MNELNISIPLPTDYCSQIFSEIRSIKSLSHDRLTLNHYMDGISDLTNPGADGYHKQLTFPALSVDPPISASGVVLYCKSIDGVIELCCRNSSGIYQMTKGGRVAYFYELGDHGPGGGTIVYKDVATGYHLEVAPEDTGQNKWTRDSYSWLGASTAIGTGITNTQNMITYFGSFSGAAVDVRNYRGGGLSDWFLPSKDELALFSYMWTDVRNKNYWSSSQYDSSGNVWKRSMYYPPTFGSQYFMDSIYVRAVRQFTDTTKFRKIG